jgi:hypothetical protein
MGKGNNRFADFSSSDNESDDAPVEVNLKDAKLKLESQSKAIK